MGFPLGEFSIVVLLCQLIWMFVLEVTSLLVENVQHAGYNSQPTTTISLLPTPSIQRFLASGFKLDKLKLLIQSCTKETHQQKMTHLVLQMGSLIFRLVMTVVTSTYFMDLLGKLEFLKSTVQASP